MDLKEELQNIDKFFNGKTEEEILEMLTECGNERILSTKEISKREARQTQLAFKQKG